MALAFVLVSTEIGAEKQVLEDLKGITEVKEAHIVYGVYDIIVKISLDDTEKLRDVITTKIRKLDRVRSTLTMIQVEGFHR